MAHIGKYFNARLSSVLIRVINTLLADSGKKCVLPCSVGIKINIFPGRRTKIFFCVLKGLVQAAKTGVEGGIYRIS